MRLAKYNLMLMCLLLWVAGLRAQQYTITLVSSSDRLPVSGVNCLMQDDEGYMWYGANQAGLCRDDSYQIMTFGFSSAPEIMHNSDVLCMVDGGDQRIWFGTREGLYVLDKKTYRITAANPETNTMRISDIAKAQDGSIWALSSAYIIHLSQQGEILRIHDSMQDGSPRTANTVYVDNGGNVWVAQWKGELLRKGSGEKDFRVVKEFSGLDAFCMVQDTLSGCYYVGTWGKGIYKIAPDCKTIAPTGIDTGNVLSMLIDTKRNVLWTTTYNQGVHCYRIQEDGLQEVSSRLDWMLHMPMVVGRVINDRFHNQWIPGHSVKTFAICHSNNRIDSRKLVGDENVFGMPVITDVIDAGTHAWLLRENGGVLYYDLERDKVEKLTFCSDTALIMSAPDGCAFIVNKDRRLWWVAKKDGGFDSKNVGRLSFNANTVLYTEADSMMYIGGKDGSLAVSKNWDNPVKIADSLGWVYKICESVDMRSIYILTYTKGLLCMDKTTGSIDTLVHNDYKFSDIAVSRSGSLWLTSYVGKVYRLEADHLKEYPDFATANGESILSVVFDELGHMWLLSKVFVREIDVETGAYRTIYANDNQLGMHTFEGISVSEGGVTIAGVGGIARVRSSSNLNEPSTKVRVAVSEYAYGGKRFITTYNQREITIPADSSDFVTLSLTNFDYLKAANNEFKFKIEGLNRGWVNLKRGENELQIQYLAKGTYKVLVMGTDGFGNWSAPMEVMTIRRLPAWWESWWAYTVYVILALLSAYYAWFLNRRINERRLRFDNLLSLYNELKKKVEQADEATAEEGSETESLDDQPVDQKEEKNLLTMFESRMLEKAIAAIEKNVDNESYSVDDFASDMCMSRMTLYRKIYAVTGQTPSDLIRSYRLDKAAKLLQTSDASITEISEKVGFSSARYFSTCFKKKYGVMPREFRG